MGECNTRMNESDAYVNKLGGCRSIRFFVKAGRKTRMNQAERLREAAMRAAADGGRVTIIGHDTPDVDSVASSVLMHALLTHWSIPSRIVLPTCADAQVERVMPALGVHTDAMNGMLTEEDTLVLVDHHQARHPGRVVSCVDHHPTDYPPDYPYVQIEPCGACALLVLRLMKQAGMRITEDQLRLAVTAAYLDSVALRSEKIAAKEAAWARKQARALGMEEAWLIREGLGLRDMSLPPEELAMTGRKEYDFGGRRVVSTYVQTDAMTQSLLNAILKALHAQLRLSGADLWVFLVHDPLAMRSTRYDVAPDGRVTVTEYGMLASRGKTVMPEVERMLREGEGHG